jgi:hypothetical protein
MPLAKFPISAIIIVYSFEEINNACMTVKAISWMTFSDVDRPWRSAPHNFFSYLQIVVLTFRNKSAAILNN